MKAWLFQDHKQKKKLGDKCPWSVGWIDPDGKRRSKRIGSKSRAQKFARRIEGQLAAGIYENENRKLWSEFRRDYEMKVLSGMEAATRVQQEIAIKHFERIVKPQRMRGITASAIADYVAKRRREGKNKRKGSGPVSPATVNKELRAIRSVLRKAVRWGYLRQMPEIEFLREFGRHPTYVTPEHFAVIYGKGCLFARWPDDQPYSPVEWWQGLLMMAYMTGWRIGSILALRWKDVNLEKGYALSRAKDNKGKRDQFIPLHPVVIDHLAKLKSFSPVVFPWPHNRRAIFAEFLAIQNAACLVLPGERDHYGFHDLRRAFATMNADILTPDVLQTLMQHRDYQTTQRYINMARQLKPAVQKLFVPPVDQSGTA